MEPASLREITRVLREQTDGPSPAVAPGPLESVDAPARPGLPL